MENYQNEGKLGKLLQKKKNGKIILLKRQIHDHLSTNQRNFYEFEFINIKHRSAKKCNFCVEEFYRESLYMSVRRAFELF